VYYQVNATYYSALGEDDKKLLLARALQMFMPWKPQVWYLDLFAGKNDIEGMKKDGYTAYLKADLDRVSLQMTGEDKEGNCIFNLSI
jgi:sucrose phosphorylase